MTDTPEPRAWARALDALGAWLEGAPAGESSPRDRFRLGAQRVLAGIGLTAALAALAVEAVLHGEAPGHGLRLALYGLSLGLSALVLVLHVLVRRPEPAGHLVAFLVFGFGTTATATSGGLTAPTAFWIPLTPLVAFVTVGARAALGWMFAAVAAILALFAVELLGVPVPDLVVLEDGRLRAFAHLLAVTILVFTVLTAWDTSRRAVIDDLRAARDDARAADRAKSTLVAIVSHELRTPMNGVLGMLDLLGDTPLDPNQRELTGTARGAARSLLDILDDLLDRSRLDAGRLGLDRVPFRPLDVLRSVQHLADLGGLARSVPVHFDLGEALDVPVAGDPRRLRQVVVNLVGNALKFTDEGEVVVRAHAEPSGDRVRFHLEVADTGIGIPAERLPHVFDAFTQVDGSITRRFGGTGLGLSIVRDLVDLMGGTIEVASEPGTGSTFLVDLPFDAADEPAADDVTDAAAAPVSAFPGMRVLVAEDNAVNQMVIRGYLQRHGIVPDVVEDGEHAVFAALGAPYDLVLMDCEMPVMDGFRASRTLREQGYDGAIVALTAHASAKVKAQCLESGMDGFLSKPISAGALHKVLGRFAGARGAGRTP